MAARKREREEKREAKEAEKRMKKQKQVVFSRSRVPFTMRVSDCISPFPARRPPSSPNHRASHRFPHATSQHVHVRRALPSGGGKKNGGQGRLDVGCGRSAEGAEGSGGGRGGRGKCREGRNRVRSQTV
eukprot:821525-Rhodomonas_salina.2